MMKLRLILGRAGSGKTRRCLDEIRERLATAPEGRSLVLILPEHATFQVEHELAATPGLGGFMRAYAFGFRRLAHRILQETGGAVRPHITELGKRLVLSRLLQQHRGELQFFQRAAAQRNFADTLQGMLQEFKSYAVTPAQLAAVEASCAGTPMGEKLHDLALLYQGFEAFLVGRYTDPEDYLTLLAEKLPQSTIMHEAAVWIDGFTWFNPQEAAVVSRLLETSECVTVSLCLEQPNAPEQAQETDLFYRQWMTRRKLLELAKAAGASVEEIELSGTPRFAAAPLLGHLERHFFTYPPLRYQGDAAAEVAVVEAANRRTEVEGIARDMVRRCREHGYRWRDMAILLREADSYMPLVETVLRDYDIPFFSDRKRQPLHHPLAELLRSALEVVVERWPYEAVFRCCKTDLLPVKRDEIDRLENYVLAFGIRGSRWASESPWRFVKRFALEEDSEVDEAQQAELERLDDARRRVAAPLLTFEQLCREARTVADLALAVYQLLEGLTVPQQLEAWGDAAEAAGDLEQALEHRQLWENVVELLDQLVETCGDQVVELAEFAAMLEAGLEGLTLSLIPPGLDYVTVAALEESSLANLRLAYVPGLNDGVLPLRGRGEGLLTDGERAELLQRGVELAPGAQADSFAERFLIYQTLTRSGEALWLSYPLADAEGRGLLPSIVVKRVRDISGAPLASLPLEPALGRERDYIVHPRRSLAALAGVLRSYKAGEVVPPVWWDVYNWALARPDWHAYFRQAAAGLFHRNQEPPLPPELAEQLYPRQGRLRGSVTRFESFQACPFKHFAQYGLGLKERAVFRLEAPDMGQFLHAALKGFGDAMQQAGRSWGSVDADECQAICGQIVDTLAPKLQNEILLSSEQHKHLVGRLQQTVTRAVQRLIEFDRASAFKPMALEQHFGRGTDALPPLVYMLPNELVLEVVGQIDRLDTTEANGQRYMLIIDYKSGGAWLRLVDVYHGLKLQLLTYLLVAQKAYPDHLPAGVLYYFLKNPSLAADGQLSQEEVEKRINALLKMPGWVLSDAQVVELLDGTQQGYSEFLKVALKKDGSFYSNCLSYIKSPEEFRSLLGHVETTLLSTAQRILAGDIAINPYQLAQRTPCGYCPYQTVCQFDGLLPENTFRRLEQPAEDVIMATLGGGEGEKA